MGEAPALFADDLWLEPSDGVSLEPQRGYETTTAISDKMYVIGGSDHDSSTSIGVRIFNKSSGEWTIPTVLGSKPKQSEGHSAVLLNKDRILIVKARSSPDDCTWFLEVDTEFVKEQKKKFETEVVAWSRGVTGEAKKPVVISGPSGVGKGTLINKLMKEFPSMFGFSVSHTTRAPREKERDGVHYHFSERSTMEKDIKDGLFLEFATVHGNLYGTSIEAVEAVADKGERCILDIDVQGARSVRAGSLEAVFVFICPPSFEELEKRLRERGTETEEQIQKRLRNAKAELEAGQASGLFDHILVNDDIDICYENLKKLLGVDRIVGATPESCEQLRLTGGPELVELPIDHQLLKIDNKIHIKFRSAKLEDSSENLFVLDVLSIKGGAPGRTRGLIIHAMDQSAGRTDGTELAS